MKDADTSATTADSVNGGMCTSNTTFTVCGHHVDSMCLVMAHGEDFTIDLELEQSKTGEVSFGLKMLSAAFLNAKFSHL